MVAGQGNGIPSVMTSYAAISGKRMDKKYLSFIIQIYVRKGPLVSCKSCKYGQCINASNQTDLKPTCTDLSSLIMLVTFKLAMNKMRRLLWKQNIWPVLYVFNRRGTIPRVGLVIPQGTTNNLNLYTSTINSQFDFHI